MSELGPGPDQSIVNSFALNTKEGRKQAKAAFEQNMAAAIDPEAMLAPGSVPELTKEERDLLAYVDCTKPGIHPNGGDPELAITVYGPRDARVEEILRKCSPGALPVSVQFTNQPNVLGQAGEHPAAPNPEI